MVTSEMSSDEGFGNIGNCKQLFQTWKTGSFMNGSSRMNASINCSLELHLTTSELQFGSEQQGILSELLSTSGIVL